MIQSSSRSKGHFPSDPILLVDVVDDPEFASGRPLDDDDAIRNVVVSTS